MVETCENIRKKSHLKIAELIQMTGIGKSKYYEWRKRLGISNEHNGKMPKTHWVTPEETRAVIDFARERIVPNAYYLKDGYRRIAYLGLDANAFAVSPTTVYRILKRAGLLNKWQDKGSSKKGFGYRQPTSPHQEWHTDIKYINFRGTFLFFIGILDGYSRYIIHHELKASMTAQDIEIALQRAHEKYSDKKPRIISDNGKQYVSKDFRDFITEVGLQHVRTSVAYPQSNGKIERFHRSLEQECIRTCSFLTYVDACEQIANYVNHYNNHRLHSSLHYLRPIDYMEGNVDELLKERQRKLDKATDDRIKYWESKKYVA